MISFYNDYSEGAHPRILQRLAETSLEQNTGYGLDAHTERACELIKKAIAEMNVQLPSYKRVKRFVVRSEEFVKTTTKKIKRFKNMGDASARDMSAMEDEDK